MPGVGRAVEDADRSPTPKPAKFVTNLRVKEYVQTRLSGQLRRPDGTVAAGPRTSWKGLNKPRRADRRWATAWSPEQILRRLVLDFRDDEEMRIRHEGSAEIQALTAQLLALTTAKAAARAKPAPTKWASAYEATKRATRAP